VGDGEKSDNLAIVYEHFGDEEIDGTNYWTVMKQRGKSS
jgi:hypothetical protein